MSNQSFPPPVAVYHRKHGFLIVTCLDYFTKLKSLDDAIWSPCCASRCREDEPSETDGQSKCDTSGECRESSCRWAGPERIGRHEQNPDFSRERLHVKLLVHEAVEPTHGL